MFLLESENSFVSQVFLQPMFYCFRENSTENRELTLKRVFHCSTSKNSARDRKGCFSF